MGTNKDKLKVLVLSTTRVRDGIGDYTRKLYCEEHLREAGVQAEIHDLTAVQLLLAPFRSCRIIHVHHEFFKFDRFASVSAFPAFAWLWAWRCVRGYTIITTVHSTYNVNRLGDSLQHLKAYAKLFPLVRLYMMAHFRLVAACSRRVIILSRQGIQNIAEALPQRVIAKKVVYIHLGVYAPSVNARSNGLLETRYGIGTQEAVFTLFGFAFPQKGYELAIEAVEILVKEYGLKNVRLMIVSGADSAKGLSKQSYMDYLKELTSSRKVDAYVRFTGYLADNDHLLEDIFDRTCCFLFPYRERQFPSAAAGSVLSAGKPVLVSDIRCFEEYQDLASFVSGDSRDLAKRMRELCASPQAIEELSEISRRNSVEFGIRKQFLKHVELFRSMVSLQAI